jgi:hypothetical protein
MLHKVQLALSVLNLRQRKNSLVLFIFFKAEGINTIRAYANCTTDDKVRLKAYLKMSEDSLYTTTPYTKDLLYKSLSPPRYICYNSN